MGYPERFQHLVDISMSRRKPTTTTKKPHCFLLELPVDLVRTLADFLTPVDLALFSQTCSAIYSILVGHGIPRLSRIDYNSYLAIRAKELPDQWACERCNTLHPISRRDAPKSRYYWSSCPRRKSMGIFFPKRRRDSRLYHDQIPIEHHHVQLALKYARLREAKYNSYLKAIIAPFRHAYSTDVGHCHYRALPKIVMDHNGNLRFLMLSAWRYYGDMENRMDLDRMGHNRICPHLEINYPDNTISYLGFNVLAAMIEQRIQRRKHLEGRLGACRRCATDFEVRYWAGCVDLYVWQDFGVEGNSALDLAWRTHHLQTDGVDPKDWNWRGGGGLRLWHEPGSIKKLYKQPAVA